MSQLMVELRDYLKDDGPETLEDGIKAIGVADPFAQAMLKRRFQPTLRPDGENADLTKEGKWLRTREKWAEEAGVAKGTNMRMIRPRTAASTSIEKVAQDVEGNIPAEALEAARTTAHILADRGNRKLTEAAGDLVAEQTNTLLVHLSTATQVAEERLARAQAAERMVEEITASQRESLQVIKRLLDDRPSMDAAE
jgi:hypothetical protein